MIISSSGKEMPAAVDSGDPPKQRRQPDTDIIVESKHVVRSSRLLRLPVMV